MEGSVGSGDVETLSATDLIMEVEFSVNQTTAFSAYHHCGYIESMILTHYGISSVVARHRKICGILWY